MNAKLSLIAELQRRNVLRAAVLYAGAVWALAQGLAQLLPLFGDYGWIARWFVIAAIIGFPFWIAFAWLYEFTPQGLKRESEIAADASITRSTGRKLDRAIIVVLAVAVVLLVTNQFVWHKGTGSSSAGSAIPAKSIAVLPFENLSTDKTNAYFADGMQDLILTKLADIGDLKVISRTSTAKYQSHPDNLKIIAQQLGVATILEGSVQKAGNEVLINVQLIDALDDNHLWAESYQRTLDNIFGVEGEVAQKVADALKVKLSGGEQKTLAAVPTRNPGAWDAFLKAETLSQKARDSESAADFADAEANYRHAIALDPEFALAYANLAYTLMVDCWFGSHSAALIPEAKAAADRALALAPNLPEARVALGFYYYWGFFNYDAAIEQFQQALKLSPTNLEARKGLAFIWRRQGKFEQALAAFGQMLAVSPRDRVLLDEYGDTYMKLRRYPEAKEQLQRALAIDPDYVDAKDVLVSIFLFGFGDAAGARAIVTPPPAWRTAGSSVGELYGAVGLRAYPDLFDRKFDAALHDFDSAPTTTQEQRIYRDAARAAIAVVAGRQASMQADCRRIKPLLDAEVTKMGGSVQVTNPAALAQLSWVDACLGQNAEAIAAARRGVKLVPLSKDVYSGQWFLTGLAQIEAHAGAPDDAINLLEELMAMPAGDSVSIKRLELDPVWDPLRNDPRFQALLEKYSAQPVSAISGASP